MGCGCLKKLLLFACLIGALFVYFNYSKASANRLASNVRDDHYWGRKVLNVNEPLPTDDVTIKPLKVAYDEEMVKDLHERLDKTRFIEPLEGSNFWNGFNGNELKKLVHYWRHNYDWKKRVEYLNSYPQFTTQIEGITIHFVRIRALGTAKIVKPILLVNGWPSNYNQFYSLAELLRKPVNDVAFEVILISRPGFGYSEQPHREGFSIADSVRIYVKLMKRLGHKKFYYAGEDWGTSEAHAIALLYPDALEGVHSAMAIADLSLKGILKMYIGSYMPSLVYSHEFEAKTFADPIKVFKTLLREFGFFIIQATKPDTVASAVIDSPAGLAAYYLEKFSSGTNSNFINLPDGGLTNNLNKDELLDNLMIYWTTKNAGYSFRYYKEFINKMAIGEDITKISIDSEVPFGFSIGEHETNLDKIKPVGRGYNIVKFDYLNGVGHFAAFENPALINEHIRKCVSIVIENQKSKNSDKSEL